MLACFQSLGTLPVCREAVNSSCRHWEMGSAATLRMREGTLSGPDALFSLRFRRSFRTPNDGDYRGDRNRDRNSAGHGNPREDRHQRREGNGNGSQDRQEERRDREKTSNPVFLPGMDYQ